MLSRLNHETRRWLPRESLQWNWKYLALTLTVIYGFERTEDGRFTKGLNLLIASLGPEQGYGGLTAQISGDWLKWVWRQTKLQREKSFPMFRRSWRDLVSSGRLKRRSTYVGCVAFYGLMDNMVSSWFWCDHLYTASYESNSMKNWIWKMFEKD